MIKTKEKFHNQVHMYILLYVKPTNYLSKIRENQANKQTLKLISKFYVVRYDS